MAELAQSVERTTLNRVVVGSIPTFGGPFFWSVSGSIVVLLFIMTFLSTHALARRWLVHKSWYIMIHSCCLFVYVKIRKGREGKKKRRRTSVATQNEET